MLSNYKFSIFHMFHIYFLHPSLKLQYNCPSSAYKYIHNENISCTNAVERINTKNMDVFECKEKFPIRYVHLNMHNYMGRYEGRLMVQISKFLGYLQSIESVILGFRGKWIFWGYWITQLMFICIFFFWSNG